MAKIQLQVKELSIDRTQYKPYTNILTSDNLFVEIDLDDDEILTKTKDRIVITPDGLAFLMGTVADSIDSMNEEYRKAKFGH